MTSTTAARWRVRLRDLGAGTAFGSMVVSGQLPIWAAALYGVGLVLALLDRRVLAAHGKLSGAALVAGAALLYLQVAGGQLDLVVAACSFAGLISLHRLLSAPGPAVDGQAHLTSLLMVSGGAALSGELWFGLFLIVFAALTCFSLAYGVIGRVMPDSAEFPSRPIGRQIGPGLASGLLLAAAFFVLFPRLSWNFAGRNVAPGLGSPTAGFAESVRLGGAGSIKTNPRAVFRAKLNPDPGVEELSAYWVGRTFDRFDGVEWRGAGEPRTPRNQVDLGRSSEQLVHQQIELLPAYGSNALVALEAPVRVGNATAHQGQNNFRVPVVEVEGEQVRFASHALGYSYHAYSRASSEGMRAPGPDLSRHLGLPETLDPRVRALAREVVGDERDPLRAAARLEDYLQKNYRYTLELEGNPADPLADFLFVRKAGHCEHFATALAVLLRAAGFPARVASGFYGGHRSGDEYVVRAGDAHAWAQVYVPRRGFVSVDATPAEARLGQPMPWLAWVAAQYEALDGLWRNHVLDYSMREQIGLARELSRPVVLPGGRWWPALRPLAGVALALLALVLGWRALGTGRRRAPGAEATELLDAAERLLRTARLTPAPGRPIEELARALVEQRHPLAPPVERVARRYLEARFGDAALRTGEKDQLIAQLRRAVAALPR